MEEASLTKNTALMTVLMTPQLYEQTHDSDQSAQTRGSSLRNRGRTFPEIPILETMLSILVVYAEKEQMSFALQNEEIGFRSLCRVENSQRIAGISMPSRDWECWVSLKVRAWL